MTDRGRSTPATDAGFSLVEALVTLVIFGIGTVALLSLAPRSSEFATRGRVMSEATSLAQAKVEELRARPKSAPELEAGTHVDPMDGVFARRWLVAQDDPIRGMKRVEVRVGYPTQSADSVAVVVTYF